MCNSGGMIEEYLIRRLEDKAFPWPIVEPLRDEFDVIVRDRMDVDRQRLHQVYRA